MTSVIETHPRIRSTLKPHFRLFLQYYDVVLEVQDKYQVALQKQTKAFTKGHGQDKC